MQGGSTDPLRSFNPDDLPVVDRIAQLTKDMLWRCDIKRHTAAAELLDVLLREADGLPAELMVDNTWLSDATPRYSDSARRKGLTRLEEAGLIKVRKSRRQGAFCIAVLLSKSTDPQQWFPDVKPPERGDAPSYRAVAHPGDECAPEVRTSDSAPSQTDSAPSQKCALEVHTSGAESSFDGRKPPQKCAPQVRTSSAHSGTEEFQGDATSCADEYLELLRKGIGAGSSDLARDSLERSYVPNVLGAPPSTSPPSLPQPPPTVPKAKAHHDVQNVLERSETNVTKSMEQGTEHPDGLRVLQIAEDIERKLGCIETLQRAIPRSVGVLVVEGFATEDQVWSLVESARIAERNGTLKTNKGAYFYGAFVELLQLNIEPSCLNEHGLWSARKQRPQTHRFKELKRRFRDWNIAWSPDWEANTARAPPIERG